MPEAHPIDPAIRRRIMETLDQVERKHQVKILFACESGSRGWGFASPDSDYDVRFIYVHPVEWYLKVTPGRDVIELPISDVYDVNGWDLRKALALLKKGNATLIEWIDSPVVYRADTHFTDQMRRAIRMTHRPERSFHHYVHMARGNFREYLQGDQIRLKKYLYVLRPLLAALWVEQGRGAAPMRFADLVGGMVTDPALRHEIDDLVAIKRRAGEAGYGAPMPTIQRFMETELARLSDATVTSDKPDFSVLDQLLQQTVLDQETSAIL